MNALLERFITPRMVSRYYDNTILLSPMFALLTVVFILTFADSFHSIHGWKGLTMVTLLIALVWIHLVVQHRWFRNVDDPQILRRNAARTTLAFSVLFVLTVGALLSVIPR